jgi:hypothetical protein
MYTTRLANIIRTGYIMDDFDQLFERAGNNVHTINVRILWGDTILTRDHRVAQHALTTGFSDFDKGAELKLLLVCTASVYLERSLITIICLHFQAPLACSATGYLILMVPSGKHTVH